MQGMPLPSLQKLPEKLLSPIPVRTNALFLYSKPKAISRSIDLSRRKPRRDPFGSKAAVQNSSKTNSSLDSGEKTGRFIDENDLNGLILLREDSRNPQAKDDCFRCINFDEFANGRTELGDSLLNCD